MATNNSFIGELQHVHVPRPAHHYGILALSVACLASGQSSEVLEREGWQVDASG
jgi:hypothetical protein